jgi:hypothetical protein
MQWQEKFEDTRRKSEEIYRIRRYNTMATIKKIQ